MERLLVFDRKKTERELLIQKMRDFTAFLSDKQLDVEEYAKAGSVELFMQKNRPLNLAIMEIKQENDIQLVQKLRSLKEQIEMMLVAEAAVSPMKYLTPNIRASSLLLRPCSKEQLGQVVKSFLASYFDQFSKTEDEPSILIENRQGKVIVPYRTIYYIEVRGKIIHVRQQDREYTKYETLNNIINTLPDYFVQSHRSFVFNTRFLERVRMSENIVYLEHGVTVPLSRTYKTKVREFMNERH